MNIEKEAKKVTKLSAEELIWRSARDHEARRMLEAASIQLKRHRPFYGVMLSSMPMINADEWLSTMATDGRRIYYNSEFVAGMIPERKEAIFGRIDKLHRSARKRKLMKSYFDCMYAPKTVREILFVICHEVDHVVSDHMSRGKGYDPDQYNIAADHRINTTQVMAYSKPSSVGKAFFPAAEKTVFVPGEEFGFLHYCYCDFQFVNDYTEVIYEKLYLQKATQQKPEKQESTQDPQAPTEPEPEEDSQEQVPQQGEEEEEEPEGAPQDDPKQGSEETPEDTEENEDSGQGDGTDSEEEGENTEPKEPESPGEEPDGGESQPGDGDPEGGGESTDGGQGDDGDGDGESDEDPYKPGADKHKNAGGDFSGNSEEDDVMGIDSEQQPTQTQEEKSRDDSVMRRAMDNAVKAAGSGAPEDARKFVEEMGKPKINYLRHLRRTLERLIKENVTYHRLHRRGHSLTQYLHQRGMLKRNQRVVMPSINRGKTIRAHVFFDVSGSFTDDLLAPTRREIKGLCNMYKEFEVTLACWSTKVGDILKLSRRNIREIDDYKIQTTYGTDPKCIFEYLDSLKEEVDQVTIYTDGIFRDISAEKDWIHKYGRKTLWIIIDNNHKTAWKAPFGNVIMFNKYLK